MSEQKQGSLTSIGTNKKEKKAKEATKTVRFSIALGESTEEACPEFNYRDLLRSAEQKTKNKLKPDGQLNGASPFADDDVEELKQVARQFEEKYGGGRKKHGRFVDYVDLGAGYDETDPFIDNTDAYDEVVPEEMTTAHGGFYINCGALEFKEVSDQSDIEETKDFKTRKRVKKVPVLPDDDVDSEETDEINHTKPTNNVLPLKRAKTEEGKDELIKKQKFVSHDRDILKKRKRRAIGDLTKRRTATVKELLREKREYLDIESSPGAETEAKTTKTVPEVKKSESKTTVPEINKTASEPKKTIIPTVAKPPSNTITDVIESVVSAARGDEELSKDSSSSVSKSASASAVSSDSDASQDAETEVTPGETDFTGREKQEQTEKTEEKLPENLPEDMKELVSALKAAALNADGKCKFFSADVNQMVLSLESKCQQLPCNARHQVYSHLASFLPCTKDTLMKRAKKLRLEAEEDKMKLPLRRLKNAIENIMPSVLESYTNECQKVAEERGLDAAHAKSSGTEDEELESKSSKIPKRKFPWTEELRANLVEVVQIKLQCVDLQKPRKEKADEILRNFLKEKIVPLWPPGWMKVSVLLWQCKEIYDGPLMKKRKLAAGLKKIVPSGTNQLSNAGPSSSMTGPVVSNPTSKSNKISGQTSTVQSVVSSAKPQTQVPAKTKPEAAPTFHHGTLGNVAPRTKSTLPLSNSAPNQVHSNPSSVSPVTSCGSSSNIRSAPQQSSGSKVGVSQVLSASPVKMKSGSDVYGRQNIAGKNGSSYLAERQSLSVGSGAQCKTKGGVDIVSSKGLDLTISGGSKVSVPSVTYSPSKINSEISIIPVSATPPSLPSQKSPVPGLSLANLPDCISVTPAVSSSSQLSNSTANQKSAMSIKQRILQDTTKERTKSPSSFSGLPLAGNMEDEGIEVIEILNDSCGMYENQKSDCFRQQNVHTNTQNKMKNEMRKRKRCISKDTLPPASLEPIHTGDETKTPSSRPKDGERHSSEETSTANDILSQMINESVGGYPEVKSLSGTAAVERASPSQSTRKDPDHSSHEKDEWEKEAKKTADEDKLLDDDNFNSETKQSAADIEIGKEISRVMKSIAELQNVSGDDTNQTLDKYSQSRNSAVTLHPVGNSKSHQSKINTNTSSQEIGSPVPRKSSTISFQDEFHRHLFRENTIKEIENLNLKAGKGTITISPIPQQGSTGSKHGSLPSEGSQSRAPLAASSRSRCNMNSGNHYTKTISGSSESYNESSFPGRQNISSVSGYHDGKSISLSSQPGIQDLHIDAQTFPQLNKYGTTISAGANQPSPTYQ